MTPISTTYRWLLLAFAAAACGTPEQQVVEQAERFCLSENLRDQLVTEKLEERPVTQHIQLTGEVSYNPEKVVQFVSWVAGVTVKTDFLLGDFVKKGQTLAVINSPQLRTLLAEQQRLESTRGVAEREYVAAQGLFNDDITSERELLEAKAARDALNAELASITANLTLFHPDTTQGHFEIRAPADGYIVEKRINPGTPISDGDNLFTVSGLDEVWVMANVYATDMQFVQAGMDVQIRTLAYPSAVFHGQISALPLVFDNNERVLKARIAITNDGLRLKPGMSADIAVEKRSGDTAVALPADAVIFDDNQYFVVVYRDDCDIQLRRISVAARDNERYFVNEGLEAGERVVTKHHLLIYERIKG